MKGRRVEGDQACRAEELRLELARADGAAGRSLHRTYNEMVSFRGTERVKLVGIAK